MIVEVMNVNLLDTVTSTVSLTVQCMYSGNVIVFLFHHISNNSASIDCVV